MLIRLFILSILVFILPGTALAQEPIDIPEDTSSIVRTVLILTLLAVVPAILICMTCFVRVVIVLSMVRHAFGMPETPPNQVIISLALFISLFVMAPTFAEMNENTLQPFMAGELTYQDAIETGSDPLRDFMLSQTREKDLITMYEISGKDVPATPEDVSLVILTPAFLLNELRVAFTIGFIILLPFLLIDLVVASILLSLGMMMVPPATISMPIKILLFVVIDGWVLIIQGLVGGFG